MEHQYPSTVDYVGQRVALDRVEILDHKMEKIEYDCRFSIDPLGTSLVRIFFFPATEDKEFSQPKLREIMRVLSEKLGFKNTAPPKGESGYKEQYHRWKRDFRESEGVFHMKRYLESFWDEPKCDLLLMIEQTPLLNCKLVKKTKEVEYYEADCSE